MYSAIMSVIKVHSFLVVCCLFLSPVTSRANIKIILDNRSRRTNEILKNEQSQDLDDIYYRTFRGLINAVQSSRSGDASESSSCSSIRDVPDELRHGDVIPPSGINSFYQKYTEAYGIPVIASSSVSNAALSRACYVLRFLLADRADLRQAYYKAYGRVAVIGRSETLTDIPEYTFIEERLVGVTRGLGAVPMAPVSSGPEENIMCEAHGTKDDTLLKTLAIGILNLAAVQVDPTIKDQLAAIYTHAISSGWWSNTLASRSSDSYFGEGVQSYFNVNAYASPPDGYHNAVSDRVALRSYDSALSGFIHNIFPCAGNYLKRCYSRGNEVHQTLAMNCPQSGWTR